MRGYVLIAIALTCATACEDTSEYCADWVASGWCTEYKDYLTESCPKSCGFCGGGNGGGDGDAGTAVDERPERKPEVPELCRDVCLTGDCEWYKSQGHCTEYSAVMMLNCAQTCGWCGARTCSPPDVQNGWSDFEMIMVPAGAVVNIYCYEGFKSYGSSQVTCNSYGELDGMASCVEEEGDDLSRKTDCQRAIESAQSSSYKDGKYVVPQESTHYIPQCDYEGNYKEIQYDGGSGSTFCVDRYRGTEIQGTRISGKHDYIGCSPTSAKEYYDRINPPQLVAEASSSSNGGWDQSGGGWDQGGDSSYGYEETSYGGDSYGGYEETYDYGYDQYGGDASGGYGYEETYDGGDSYGADTYDYGADSYGADTYDYGADSYGADTYDYGADSYGADPYAADPYAADPYAADPYAADPYAADPYAADPYAADPYAADPYAADPYASDSWGSDSGDSWGSDGGDSWGSDGGDSWGSDSGFDSGYYEAAAESDSGSDDYGYYETRYYDASAEDTGAEAAQVYYSDTDSAESEDMPLKVDVADDAESSGGLRWKREAAEIVVEEAAADIEKRSADVEEEVVEASIEKRSADVEEEVAEASIEEVEI